MSVTKVTVTTNNEVFQWPPLHMEESFRAGYCVGLAHSFLPEELRGHFEHFGVRYWSSKKMYIIVDVSLVAQFPYNKKPNGGGSTPQEEFKRVVEINFPLEGFLQDSQIQDSAKMINQHLLRLLEDHITTLSHEIEGAKKSVLIQLSLVKIGRSEA